MPISRFRFPGLVLALCITALILIPPTFAQSSNGSVRGLVRDQADAVIQGASLTLTSKATNVSQRLTTNEAGLFVFPSVPPGEYVLTVAHPGMETLNATLQVQVQVSTTFNAVLKAGSTNTTVSVTAEAPVVVSDSPTLGHVLERQRIEQLPLNGRNIENLLVTVPGLSAPKPGGSIQVRSWGMMAGAHDYLLDGASLSEAMWNEGTIQRPPGLDTIQEFKVENNSSSAKYSRMTSIILSTKSGTNELHGALFETNRDNAYGKARARTDLGSDFPDLHRNEYGGTLGGPVYLPKLYNGRDRTFFFTAYEGVRKDTPVSIASKVPSAAMRQGDFSGLKNSQGRLYTIYDPWTTGADYSRQPFNYGGKLNQIDPQLMSPVAKWVFDSIPMPTYDDRNPLLTNNWFGPAPDNTTQWTITERFDHRFSDKDQFYARYTQGGQTHLLDPYNWAGVVPGTDGIVNMANYSHRNRSLAGNYVRTISPTLVNELSVTYSFTYEDQFTGQRGRDYGAELGIPNPFKVDSIPYIAGIGIGPNRYIRPAMENERNYSYYIAEDNVTKIVGKHELQFGAHGRWDILDTLPQRVFATPYLTSTGVTTGLYNPDSIPSSPMVSPYTGSAIAGLFLGTTNYQNSLTKGSFGLRRQEYAFYFQDNFKVTPRLTLNLGVRWQLSPFPYEANDVIIPGFDPNSKTVLLSQNVDKLVSLGVTTPVIVSNLQNNGFKFSTYQQAGYPSRAANSNWRDIGPHLGMAYRISDGPKSFVVRGGLSKSFFNEGIWTWMDQGALNPPFFGTFTNESLTSGAQSPDGIGNWGLRNAPTIIAGKNSQNAIDLNQLPPFDRGGQPLYYFNPNQPTSYVWDWNFTIEKEVMHNTVARAGYVGNHGGNQMQAYLYNEPMQEIAWYMTKGVAKPTGDLSGVGTRPFDQTTYGTLGENRKSGYSNFSGVQFQLERHYEKGVAFQLSYVIGNTIRAGGLESGGGYASPVYSADAFLPGLPTNYNDLVKLQTYGRDISVPKHLFRWNFLIDLPFGRGKHFARNAKGIVNGLIGGWQVAGLGSLNSTYLTLDTSHWGITGAPVQQYGYKYPITDCTSGTCQAGYLWWNGYIPANKINTPDGIMGVPADYQPAVKPLIPWGSTAIPDNFPSGANIQDYWDTDTVWVKLKDGSVVEQGLSGDMGGNQPTLHPWRSQNIPGPIQWNQDASLFKNFTFKERFNLRFTFDAFNIFNHPNNIGNNGSSDYNTSSGIMLTDTQANEARQLQLSVRFSW